jgi:hypothetical protein
VKPEQRAAAQVSIVEALEELTDITVNSISGKDKIIASAAVDALKDLGVEYLACKASAREDWFSIGPDVRMNPDFVAMDPEVLRDIEGRRTWVEWKILRQYLGIFYDALPTMRDINYLIAIDTRYLGEAALEARDEELVRLAVRFMNSYLRATLNARDVRSTYHLCYQYRLLVEALLRTGHGAGALESVRYMHFYGQLGFGMELPFVTETVAYDVAAICEAAHQTGAPEGREMLDLLLALGRLEGDDRREVAEGGLDGGAEQRGALAGVRKAQAKLAAYFLMQGDVASARLIADAMAAEPRARLEEFRDELRGVTSKEYWEITERGRRFDYMPEAQRAHLTDFFALLEVPEPAVAATYRDH